MPERPRILLVEDEKSIADILLYALDTDGFKTSWVSTGGEALAALTRDPVDLAIVDIGLPDLSGFELFAEIRRRHPIPVIFLTARDSEVDRVSGLEMGADDYVVKPFSPRELMARIKAALRRYDWERLADTAPVEKLVFKDIVVYPGKHRVVKAGKDIMLTPKEFEVFTLLVKANGEPVSRSGLIKEIYGGSDDEVFDRTIDAYIKNIRKKIQDDPGNPTYIESIYGVGYRILV